MSVLDWLKRPFERRAMTLRDPDGWRVLFGTQTAAGTIVTPETALGHPAILGAVRLLAELTASLPLVVYERTDAGRRRATEHPVYQLLHEAPNDAMTPFTFKETLVLHLLLFGNAYALVVRSGGRPVALWPLHPTRVHLDDQDGVFTYKVSSPGGVEQYPPEDIVHVPILAPDGVRGQSPVTLAREAIGAAALAAEEHAALYFANGAQPSGVLVHPGQLSPEAAQRLRESWRAAHGGRNRGGTAVLEGGMEYKPISNTAKDAQLIEARQFAMRLLAAAMRIPPHLLDPSVRGAYANVETQSLEFLTFSLQPLLTRFEEAFTRRLFTAQERRRYYAEFLVDGLLRADTRTRYEAYKTAINGRLHGPRGGPGAREPAQEVITWAKSWKPAAGPLRPS